MRNGFLKSLVINLLFPYGSKRRILRGVCRGMMIRLAAPGHHGILFGYEMENQAFLKQKIKKGMVVYDVGANVGQLTIFFSRLVGPQGAVVAFEPHKQSFDTLLENIRLNDLQNVQAQETSLGDRQGDAFLFSKTSMSAMSSIEGSGLPHDLKGVGHGVETIVKMKSLDSFIGRLRPPDFIKIDTEGSAGIILKGASQTLQKYRPLIFLELHDPEEQAAAQQLIHQGYQLHDLSGRPVEDTAACWASPLWCVPVEVLTGPGGRQEPRRCG